MASGKQILENIKAEKIDLPTLEYLQSQLPKFNGDILLWKEFWEQFGIHIHMQPFGNACKLEYLKTFLEGEALAAISSLDITHENYPKAIQILKDRFGKPGRIIDAHYAALYQIKPSTSSPNDVKVTLYEIEKHLNILKSMGEDINHNNLRTVILNKFPDEWIKRLRTRIKTEDENVETIIQEIELLIPADASSSKPREDATTQERSAPNNRVRNRRLLPCIFCKGKHYNSMCYKSISERISIVRGRCYKCLKLGHTSMQCRRKVTCYYCKKPTHNTALCRQGRQHLLARSIAEIRKDFSQFKNEFSYFKNEFLCLKNDFLHMKRDFIGFKKWSQYSIYSNKCFNYE